MSGARTRRRPGPAGGAGAPASLREALAGVPENERDLYLYLREAVLALGGTAERFRPEGRSWWPSLSSRHGEIARVRFTRPGRGRRKGMAVELPLPPDLLAELAEAAELRPGTRTALRKALDAGDGAPRLSVSDEGDLAEVVAALLLAEARLRSSR